MYVSRIRIMGMLHIGQYVSGLYLLITEFF